MRIIPKILLILVLLLSFSCAPTCKTVKVKLPEDPKILPVKVHKRAITGKDVDNVITNHINIWKYVEEVKKLGNFK